MDSYSTHQAALCFAMRKLGLKNLRAFENGTGWYSTPLLHHLCSNVISTETEESWAAQFINLSAPHHKIVLLKDGDYGSFLDRIVSEGNTFDIVLADGWTGPSRMMTINKLRDVTKLFIIHDQENFCRGNYGACYENQWDTMSSLKYKMEFPAPSYGIITVVASDTIEL